jgi:hypothetical protein
MKKICVVIMMLSLTSSAFSQNKLCAINAVIGNESFIQTFGKPPDHSTNEVLRIQTHLMFVEQMLRNKNVTGLTKKQKRNREKALNLLHEYWLNGVFPSNYDYPEERKPCFIDRDRKICAVGYLVEKTEGRNVAEKINAEHQYEFIEEMNESIVAEWANEYGLSLEECAMIQPTYGGLPTEKTVEMPVKTSYGISSGFLGGTNIAANIFNLKNSTVGNYKIISKIGLATGTAQIILGLANIRKDQIDWGINNYDTKYSYKAQRNLSYINVAAGAATLVTSSLNLLLNKNKENVKNNISFYSTPSPNNEMNLGLSLVRRL